MHIQIEEINSFFDELDEIYENRHRYSLEWAFDDAQNKLDSFKRQMVDKRLKAKCTACPKASGVHEDFSGYQKKSGTILKKTKWYSRLFSNMFSIINLIEIIVSILLVLGLSHLSHSGEAFIESEWFSFMFVAIFAFLKVVIERYHIKPRIDAWGWRLYAKSSQRLRHLTLSVNAQADKPYVPTRKEEVANETLEEFAKDFMVA